MKQCTNFVLVLIVFACLAQILLATLRDVVRCNYISSVVVISLLAKFYPISWYLRLLYDKNW